jgi:pimeloyl-ACP methyl ester carboxylesterase
MPVLAMVGDHDVSEMRTITSQLAARIPTAQFVRVPDVAHLPQLETPGRLAALLTEFIDSLDPA